MPEESKEAKTRRKMEELVDEFVRQMQIVSPDAALMLMSQRARLIDWFFKNGRKMKSEDLQKFLMEAGLPKKSEPKKSEEVKNDG
jgi:hypothetical protein